MDNIAQFKEEHAREEINDLCAQISSLLEDANYVSVKISVEEEENGIVYCIPEEELQDGVYLRDLYFDDRCFGKVFSNN